MGGGIGMGNTCKPMAVLFQCMTKFTTNKKKKIIKLRLWMFKRNVLFRLIFLNPFEYFRIQSSASCLTHYKY